MGKVRIKTLGDEDAEKEQQKEAQKRKEARIEVARQTKKVDNAQDASDAVIAKPDKGGVKQSDGNEIAAPSARNDKEQKKTKKEKFSTAKKAKHSQSYTSIREKIDTNKTYSLKEALAILPTIKRAKFDETVELHINTTDTGVSGSLTLPHGTGKKIRVKIADASKDPKGVDELVSQIEGGTLDFDILIATPDAMPKLARVAKVLGPKGLMPNPKNGTISPKPEIAAEQFEKGQISFKTEAKASIIHAIVGKVSFGEEKLSENIVALMQAIPNGKVHDVTLKSTMSPGLKISL